MIYQAINVTIYIISVLISMVGLSCINFEKMIKKGKIKEFYILYLVLSISLGYLFGSFILRFANLSFYNIL